MNGGDSIHFFSCGFSDNSLSKSLKKKKKKEKEKRGKSLQHDTHKSRRVHNLSLASDATRIPLQALNYPFSAST